MENLISLLSKQQQQIVDGSLLGDGCLRHLSGKHKTAWNFIKPQSQFTKYKNDKKSYMDWHFSRLRPFSSNLGIVIQKLMVKGEEKHCPQYRFSTRVHPIWYELGKKWYLHDTDGNLVYDERGRKIKVVPRDLKLTPLSACVWFMDDGSNWAKDANAIFCTHGFSIDDVDFLVDRLKEDLGIQCKRRQTKKRQPLVYVGRKGYFDLMDCIRSHMEWECFAYKVDTSAYKKGSGRGEDHHSAKMTEEKVRRAFSLRQENMQHQDIANQLGVSKTAITLILNGERWSHLGLFSGSKRKHIRLTEEQKVQALKLLQEGFLEKDVAARFNVSQPTINRLRHRK